MVEKRANRFRDNLLLVIRLSDSRYEHQMKEVEYYFDAMRNALSILKEAFFMAKNGKFNVEIAVLENWLEVNNRTPSSDTNSSFHRLMTNRVNRILDVIRLMINLANKSHYDYAQSEAKQVIKWMEKNLEIAFSHFAGINEFHLGDVEVDDELKRGGRP